MGSGATHWSHPAIATGGGDKPFERPPFDPQADTKALCRLTPFGDRHPLGQATGT